MFGFVNGYINRRAAGFSPDDIRKIVLEKEWRERDETLKRDEVSLTDALEGKLQEREVTEASYFQVVDDMNFKELAEAASATSETHIATLHLIQEECTRLRALLAKTESELQELSLNKRDLERTFERLCAQLRAPPGDPSWIDLNELKRWGNACCQHINDQPILVRK